MLLLSILSSLVSAEPTWRWTWADEFNGTSVNTSRWGLRNNESHCCGPFGKKQELQLYLASEVTLDNGHLVIQTKWNPTLGPKENGSVGTFDYTSGWLDTEKSFTQKYGRFVANMSLPTRKAEGIWPAFWLLPATPCWPTGGEIDIMEMVGNPVENDAWGSYHWAPPNNTYCGKDRAPIPGMGIKPHGAPVDWQTGCDTNNTFASNSLICFLNRLAFV